MIYERKKTVKIWRFRGVFLWGRGSCSSQLYSKFTYRLEAAVYSTTSLVNFMQDNFDTRLDGQKSISPIFLKILEIKMFAINMLVSE